MENYERIAKRFLSEYEVIKTVVVPGFVKVDICPAKEGWGVCTFIFSERFITCFGDVSAYTWRCTWDTAESILKGNCYTRNYMYLSEKLEHSSRLERFDSDLMMETLEKLKKERLEDMDEDEKEEFLDQWEENEYMLDDVDEHRLNGVDDFFDAMGMDCAWEYYSHFFKLPNHYDCAVAMLCCIEDYFGKRNGEPNG